MAYRHLEDRIVAERIAIVGVLVARRDRKHPQPKHLLERVLDALRLAPAAEARRQAPRQRASSRPRAAQARPHPTRAARRRTRRSISCGQPMEDRTAGEYLRS